MPTAVLSDKLVKKRILSMAIPITAENILQMTAGVVSMAMVSRISPLAVGAIGISNIIFRIIWAVLKGISTGCSVFVAQSHGAGEEKRLIEVSKQAFILSLGLAIVFQQLIYWFTGPLLRIFNPSPELLSEGTLYLRLLSWSLPMTAVILLVAGILQGMGNAKTPMLIIGILNGFNIVLSYGLIFGRFGLPAMGLAGAAWAYNISYLVAALMGLWVIFSRGGIFEASEGRRGWSFNKGTMSQLIHFALPTTMEISFWQFASVIMTRAILTFGETTYAAYQLGLQAESISYMPAAGFGIAASTFVGQAIGSGDKEMGRTYMKHLIKISIIITAAASGVLIIFPRVIMSAMSDNPEVISVGAIYLIVMGIVQIPQNIASLLNGALRGAGYPKAPMINAGVGLWIIRIPLILLVTYVLKTDIVWIWVIMGLDLISRFFLALLVYRNRDIFSHIPD